MQTSRGNGSVDDPPPAGLGTNVKQGETRNETPLRDLLDSGDRWRSGQSGARTDTNHFGHFGGRD
jgi:hypothetical protein